MPHKNHILASHTLATVIYGQMGHPSARFFAEQGISRLRRRRCSWVGKSTRAGTLYASGRVRSAAGIAVVCLVGLVQLPEKLFAWRPAFQPGAGSK
jgi:hypothetical protein